MINPLRWSVAFFLLVMRCDFSEGTDVHINLTSNLNEGNTAYDRQTVTFRCIARGNGTLLSWISEGYIGTGGTTLAFFSIYNSGRTERAPTNPNTVATLISATTDDTGVVHFVSELRIQASVNSSVVCQVTNGHDSANSIDFRVVPSNVQLTSNLNEGNIAYDGQTVTFRCTARGTGTLLSWISKDYIDAGGTTLAFFSIYSSGRTERAPTNPNTVATLISATTDDDTGVVHFVSELRIQASVQYQNSSVECQVPNGHDSANTTDFQVIAAPSTTVVMIEDQSTVTRDVPTSDIDMTEDSPQRQKDPFVIYVAAACGGAVLCIIIIIVIIMMAFIVRRKRGSKVYDESGDLPRHDVNQASEEKVKHAETSSTSSSEGSQGSDDPLVQKT